MTLEEFEQWREAFEQFHARFADLFERSESRDQAKKYLRGLLASIPRKNSGSYTTLVKKDMVCRCLPFDRCSEKTTAHTAPVDVTEGNWLDHSLAF